MRLYLLSSSALLLLLPMTSAVSMYSLPTCMATCLDKYNPMCSQSDLACMCRSSTAASLSKLVTCYKSTCDKKATANMILTALAHVCKHAGSPIPESSLSQVDSDDSGPDGVFTTGEGGIAGIAPATIAGSSTMKSPSAATPKSTSASHTPLSAATPQATSQAPILLNTSASPPVTNTALSASKPTEAMNGGGDGSLFSTQDQSAGARKRIGGLFGLSVALIAATVLF